MVKYVYDQTFEILLVKFWDFLAILTKFISKFEFVGMNINTDSKRAFYALSNGILKYICLWPNFWDIFGQSLAKNGHLTIFFLKTTRLGFDIKTDSKRTLNALSNGIYKFVFLHPDFFENLVKVDQKLVSLTIGC